MNASLFIFVNRAVLEEELIKSYLFVEKTDIIVAQIYVDDIIFGGFMGENVSSFINIM